MKNSDLDVSEDSEQQGLYIESLQKELNEIEGLILDYVENKNADSVTRVLVRKVHTIKGVAGGYGLDLISVLAHRMEDQLSLANLSEVSEEEKIHRLLKIKDSMTEASHAYFKNNKEAIKLMATSLGLDQESQDRKKTTGVKKITKIHRLLLVDSSQVTLRRCISALKNLQVDISTEKNGFDALGRLLKENFDSVIISLHSPMLSGPDLAFVLKNVSGLNSKTPVTVLTSDQSLEDDPNLSLPHMVIEKGPGLSQRLIEIYSKFAEPRQVEVDAVKKSPFHKLMVVDDSEHIHNLVKLSLKKYEDIEIVMISNPLEAFAKASTLMPELILLDAEMPELSGKEVCKSLKKSAQTKSIPVFFLTALTDVAKTNELLAAGGATIIQKPFSPKTFAQDLFKIYSSKKGIV